DRAPGRHPRGAISDRVPAARVSHPAPGPGPHPRAAARKRLGLGLCGGVPDRRDLHQLPAPQAGPARAAHDPHSAWCRLQPPAAGTGAGRAQGMTRARRLSLRTRMLVLLIGVTAIFLLIMGTVSAIVLRNQWAKQFNANLVAVANTRTPTGLAAKPNGYTAVEVTGRILVARDLVVEPLTRSMPGTQQMVAGVQQLASSGALGSYLRHRQTFTVPDSAGGPVLRGAVARVSPGDFVVVAQPVSEVTDHVRGFMLAELITGGALITLLAIGGEWLIGRGLQPLDKMAVTANEITSKGDLTTRMPDAGDRTEVGQLGSAINTMLDRIQHAFGARLRSEQKVREFAADASHELRTPLT